MDLSGRTIMVTGASSGIGRETAVLLAELGATVVAVGRKHEELEKTAAMIASSQCLIEPFDLSVMDSIPGWLKRIAQDHGPLAGLVHSAGVQSYLPLRILSEAKLQETLDVNLKAAVGLAKGFRQKGVCSNPSSIVYLTSVMGLVGQPGQAAYSASKGALVALAKSLALEVAREGIRINCIAPAVVLTEMSEKGTQSLTGEQLASIQAMHPLGLGKPRDIANAAAFLIGDTGRWITGTTLVVDGGYTAH